MLADRSFLRFCLGHSQGSVVEFVPTACMRSRAHHAVGDRVGRPWDRFPQSQQRNTCRRKVRRRAKALPGSSGIFTFGARLDLIRQLILFPK
jgi:hypothetical protein